MVYWFHLVASNLDYVTHMKRAFVISYKLLTAGMKVFIHGIFPDIFITSASDTVKELYEEM